MKNILSKEELESIREFCADYNIMEYTINPDGSVDVFQDVAFDSFINRDYFTHIPFKFNIIHGDFTLSETGIEKLHNMPHTINGNCNISDNYLESLEGCPGVITGNFDFTRNNITSLYVGDYDVNIGGDIEIYGLALPSEITDFTQDTIPDEDDFYGDTNGWFNADKLQLIFKYQRHYEIWNKNGSLNTINFEELQDEINDGLR